MDDEIHLTDFITTETKEHQLRTQNVLYMLLELEKRFTKRLAKQDVKIAELERDYEKKLFTFERYLRRFIVASLVGFLTVLTLIDALFNFYK